MYTLRVLACIFSVFIYLLMLIAVYDVARLNGKSTIRDYFWTAASPLRHDTSPNSLVSRVHFRFFHNVRLIPQPEDF